jgi:hypothetical protein
MNLRYAVTLWCKFMCWLEELATQYDRSIIVKSSPIDFIEDNSRFIAMLKGIATLTPLQWGYEMLVRAPHLPRRPQRQIQRTRAYM